LRWKNEQWEVKAGLRCGWYGYEVQQVNGESRERSYFVADLRLERHWGKRWLTWLAGEREWNLSNDPLDEYRLWMASGGVGVEF